MGSGLLAPERVCGANAPSIGASGGAGWGIGSVLGLGLGSGLGYGLSPWLFGPALSNWGYPSYSNPYNNGGYGAGSTLVAAARSATTIPSRSTR